MKRLILIRHGETDYTKAKRYCGHENTPLNAKGIKQVKRLGKRLKNMKVDKVYCSSLKRTRETAEIVFPGRTLLRRRGLREIDFGKFSGLTFEEACRIHPRAYKTWIGNPLNAKIPEGESMRGFAKRVIRCFKKISGQNPKKIVVLVAHGGPIHIILLKLLGLGLDKFWDLKQAVTAFNVIDFKNGAAKVLKINDTSHLD